MTVDVPNGGIRLWHTTCEPQIMRRGFLVQRSSELKACPRMSRAGLALLGIGLGIVVGCSSGEQAAQGSADAITVATPELPEACHTPEIVSLERPQSSV